MKGRRIFQGDFEVPLQEEDVELIKKLRRYSGKDGKNEPTNLDQAGNEITCPPKAVFSFNETVRNLRVKIGDKEYPAVEIKTENLKPCGFACAPTIPDYPEYRNPRIPRDRQYVSAAALRPAMQSSNTSSYPPSSSTKGRSERSIVSR